MELISPFFFVFVHQGSFAIPAPPLLPRRINDADNFVTPKTPMTVTSSLQNATVTSSATSQSTTITNISPTPTTVTANVQLANSSPTKQIETKDATLIELLKRGTKVAVKRGPTELTNGTLTLNSANAQTTTVLLPSNVSVSSPVTPTSTPPLAISLSGNSVKNTPLALTISQNSASCNDVYTLAYSTDSPSTFFNENDVYNVPDTAMLLQAVDSIQLLQNSTTTGQLGDLSTMGDYTLADSNDLNDATLLSRYTPSRQIQAVLNSPLPESLAEFSTLHSKDYVLYGTANENCESPTTRTSTSPLPNSPLSYPTPPASHEGITQTSPFLEDAHNFGDASSFFDDKKGMSFLDDNGLFKDPKDSRLSDCEQILKLKHELFNDAKVVVDESLFFNKVDGVKDVYETKASDLLAESNNQNDNIDEFNQNLSFLDVSQNFIEEALQEVLPNESISCEQNSDIDLYYLPSMTFQSQMMLNSDDPLLSSSPKDFANKHQIHRFDFNQYSSPSVKKPKLDAGIITTTTNVMGKNLNDRDTVTVAQSEQISSEIFLSPSTLSINVTPAPNNITPNSVIPCSNQITTTAMTTPATPLKDNFQILMKKRPISVVRKNVVYKSNLRNPSASHYTPTPMLNPDRTASGLYAEVAKDTNEDLIDFDFAEASCVSEFGAKSKVNIGSDFQATIPSECPSLSMEYEMEDQQLWSPDVLPNERQIQRFVDLAKSSAVPLGCHSEEMALKALQDANGETHKAILAMLQEPPSSIHKRWQQQEVETFLKGLEDYGKNFYKIAKEVNACNLVMKRHYSILSLSDYIFI